MQRPVKLILGMEEPPCRLVAKELIRRGGEMTDMPCVVVVPTRESARMLKEQLAVTVAAGKGRGAFVSPKIIPLSQLTETAGGKTASLGVSLCVWQAVLRGAEGGIAALFPKTDNWNDEAWLHAAGDMQKLFRTLAQEGVEVGGAAWRKLSAEDKRWETLLTLRQRYLDKLRELRLNDADAAVALHLEEGARVILACVPTLSKQAEQLLAASSHPVEVWLPCEEAHASWFDAWGRPGREWLQPADRDEPVLARDDRKKRLIVTTDAWALSAETVRAAARANAAEGGKLHAVGLGVCEPDLAPAIAEEFALHGVTTYRPEGIPFSATSWQRVLDALGEMSQGLPHRGGGNEVELASLAVAPLAELLRQPVITRGLDIEDSVRAMQEIRELRARFLPDRVPFLRKKMQERITQMEEEKAEKTEKEEKPHKRVECALEQARALEAALGILLPWLQRALGSGKALLQALLSLAEAQPINTDSDTAASVGVRDACTALLDMGAGRLSRQGALILLGKQLSALSLRGEREGCSLSLNGWMELLYCPAERLVIAGMHDRQIPEKWPVSPLLTRSARQQLGMHGDEDRAARDAFLLRCLLGSRKPGNVTFVFSLFDIRKDPTAPTPLLFTLCPKNRLPELVAHFFGRDDTRPHSPSPAYSSAGWNYLHLGQMTPEASNDAEAIAKKAAQCTLSDFGLPNPMEGRHFSPSVLADFLKCPLSFWLKRVRHLKDDNTDDDRDTLQANHVGDCLHRVLEQFVRLYPSLEKYRDVHAEVGEKLSTEQELHAAQESVRQELLKIFEQTYEQEYGKPALLPRQMQRENMKARLAAYAGIHTALWKEGWHAALDEEGKVMVEYEVNWAWQGHNITMKIDRVDERYTPDGRRELRVIDYKTGGVESCLKKHMSHLNEGMLTLLKEILPDWVPPLAYFGNRKEPEPFRWVELQLPLYVLWVKEEWVKQHQPEEPSYEAAYICLSRKPDDTKLLVWGSDERERGLFSRKESAESLIDNAARWAKSCMDMIAAGQCLLSAEQLGWQRPKYDLFQECTKHATLHELFLPQQNSVR